MRGPSESLVTVVSKKGMVLSFSISMVEGIVGCCLFRCGKKLLKWSRSQTESFIYISSPDLRFASRIRVKEAIHIRLHPNNIYRDSGIETPKAWIATIKQHQQPIYEDLGGNTCSRKSTIYSKTPTIEIRSDLHTLLNLYTIC